MSARQHVKDAIDRIPSPTEEVTSEADVLNPCTFWELIEKLLLHTSVDEKRRQRHNAALTALCRGIALQRSPRQKRSTGNTKKASLNQKDKITAFLKPSSISDTNTASSKDKKKGRKSKNPNKKDNTKEVITIPNHTADNGKIKQTEEKDAADDTAKETQSECCVNDSDVVFIKDLDIPASERLWRFAIRNRKQKNDEKDLDIDANDVSKHIPNARSNKAIYEGLKQRLEEAKKLEEESVDHFKKEEKSKPKKKHHRKHKCHKTGNIQKSSSSKCDNTKYGKKSPKQKSSRSTPVPGAKSEDSPSNSSCESSSKSSCDSSSSLSMSNLPSSTASHDSCVDTIKTLIESSELMSATGSENDDVTPENFESKKIQYDKVIKRRLSCGSQLETLNKEIVNKKLNPRTTLSRETTRKYAELKTDYLRLCYQESSLRHQIAMLQAEIYLMQNKAYHKRPANVKTITLDSMTTKLRAKSDVMPPETNVINADDVMLFPPLKAPKPLIFHQQLKQQADKLTDNAGKKNDKVTDQPRKTVSEQTGTCGTSLPILPDDIQPRGICSMYSLSTGLEILPQRFHSAVTLKQKEAADEIPKLPHRLPKMTTCTITEFPTASLKT